MPSIDRFQSLIGGGDLRPLPESFLFGVSTADHQCEAYDPNHIDIRDVWERAINPNAARKMATDFWNRYEEDIDLAYSLGCNAFRFSIAWSKVEPQPGQFNDDALDHYQRLIKKITSCSMLPVLTLHHFTWPVHVERQGGMIGYDFPAAFARYAAKIAEHFSREVPYWITFNEPNLLMGGYLKPWWDANYAAPPGMPQGTTTQEQVLAVGRLIRNLFLSHKAAYAAIKAENPGNGGRQSILLRATGMAAAADQWERPKRKRVQRFAKAKRAFLLAAIVQVEFLDCQTGQSDKPK